MYSLNRGVHAAAGLLALVAMIVALQQLIPLTTQYDIGLLYNDRETLRVMRVSVAALDWRLVMVTLPTVVHHLIMAFQSDTAWSVYISRRFSLLRWTEYSITNTAMTLRIAVLCSVSDIGSLIQIGTTAVAIIGLGAIHEYMLQWSKGTAASRASISRVAWSVYGISSWLFVAQWSIILGWFLNAVAQADDKPPEWVSAVVAFVLLLDCGFPIVAMVNAMWPETRYERIDLAYAILSLSVKQFYIIDDLTSSYPADAPHVAIGMSDSCAEELAWGPTSDRRTYSNFAWWMWLALVYKPLTLLGALFTGSEANETEETEPLLVSES